MSHVFGVVAAGVLIVGVTGYAIARVFRFIAAQWFLGVLWRFLSGYHRDNRPGRHRRIARRWLFIMAAVAFSGAFVASPGAAEWGALRVALSFCALFFWWPCEQVRYFWFRYKWLRPAHLASHRTAEIDPRRKPHAWLSAAPDRSWVRAELPAGWQPDDKAKKALVGTLTAKFGMESPDHTFRLAGPKPLLVLEAAQPPPARVSLADVRPELDRVKADELVWGRGKRSVLVTTSLSGDSPHIGLSMGSGAGKSVTARALLAQMLYRGCIGLILDYKMISHQWARDLPNVVIARRPAEIHAALMWLGREADRRNEVALAGADMDGNVHAVVGPRLIVVCEELNATVARLRAYWRDERNGDRDLPQRSPALDALDAISFMGRQVLMNIVYIGQRLSVKASGGDGDARENIGVIAFGRYSASNWKMLAGDHPMPAKSLTPGRIQVVASGVRETQGVFMTAREARALALAGEVAPLPYNMPGARRVPVASATTAEVAGRSPEQPVVLETDPVVPMLSPGRVTLSEAVAEGIVSCSLHAVRKAAQRDGEFPRRLAMRGLAGEYDAVALAEWDAGRR